MRYCECPEGFEESPNPRRIDCVRCGRLEQQPILDAGRIQDYFETLREMLESAGRITKPDPSGQPDPEFDLFKSQAIARLHQGARTYGPNNFMRAEIRLPEEAIEEYLDACNYGLMELTKSRPDDTDAVLLGQSIYHAFCAYQCLRGYQAAITRRQ